MSEVIANMKHCPICNKGHQIGEKCEPLTENDQNLIKHLKEVLLLRAQLSEAQSEIERITRIHKADMENMFQRFEIAANAAIKQVARAEKAEAENAALCARLKGVEDVEEYKNHEFCKDVECTALEYNTCSPVICHKTAKHFHKWLKQHGYKIVKVASIV